MYNTRTEKYVNTITPINEGSRNNELLNIGLCLRGTLGLSDDVLETTLQEVNVQKCTPPLPENEVARIAKSVDKSNVPLGDANNTFERNGRQFKKTSVPETRTVYTVSVSSDPVSVESLLQKSVSIYPHCRATAPSMTLTIDGVLSNFKTGGKSKSLIESIRNETDKAKRTELKRGLPGVVFGSEPQTERNNNACVPNGIICLDWDTIPADELLSAKSKIAAVDYIFAVGLSVSGTGIFALAAYKETTDLKTLIATMQSDFAYEIDKSRSDLCGLRFTTLDPNLIIKDAVRPAILTACQSNIAIAASKNAKFADENSTSTYTDTTDPLPYVPFPVECLPAPMRNIVKTVQRVIGLKDSSTPAVCCLAVVSAVIGASCRIRIKEGYQQPAHIFTGIVAKSSQAKSPVLEYLLHVLQETQSVWIDEWQSANEDHKRELVEWKAAKKGAKGMCPIEPPPPKRLIVSDITIETIGQRLKENPFGLLLYADELDVLLGNMGRYSNGKDLPYYITIHNGGTLTIDRKTSGGLFHVPRPALAMCGGIQPQILRKRLNENPDYFHSGFIARFFIAMPPVEAIKLNSRALTDEEKESYERFITDMLSSREGMLVDGKVEPQVFPISSAAWNVLLDYQHRHADLSIYETDRGAAIEGKFLTNTARIALILHVARLTDKGIHWKQVSPVSEETMQNACIIAEWFIEESKRIFSVLAGESADGELPPEQREILKVLRKSGKPLTQNEIRFANRQTQKIDVEKTLKELFEAGLVQDVFREHENKGRPAIQYKITDTCAVSVSGNEKNTDENGTSTYADSTVADSDTEVIEGFGE